MATTKEINNFIETIQRTAPTVNTRGLFLSVIVAQAAIESGWGCSQLAKKYNNLFGVKKGSSWTGKTVTLTTTEYVNGIKTTVNAQFRVYNNWAESISDRCKLLASLPRYKNVMEAKTPEEQARAFAGSGYATDPNYSNKLISIIEKYDLKKLDGFFLGSKGLF